MHRNSPKRIGAGSGAQAVDESRIDSFISCSDVEAITMTGERDADRGFGVGDRVFFWSGRGSHGYGVIRAIKNGRAFIDPDSAAIKGSDFRTYAPGSAKKDRWGPRDHGLLFSHLNTPPNPWYQNS